MKGVILQTVSMIWIHELLRWQESQTKFEKSKRKIKLESSGW